MGQLDDAIEANRRRAEAQQADWERQEAAAATAAAEAARRAAEEAAPLVREFIERAKRLGIKPDHTFTKSILVRHRLMPSGYLGGQPRREAVGRRKVLDSSLIRCWQLAPDWKGYNGRYYLSEDGFHMVERHEYTPARNVWYSSHPRSDFISNWIAESPTLQDVVFYQSAEREGPRPRVDTMLEQAMVYFFQRHPKHS